MRAEDVELGHLVVPDGGGPAVIVVHDVWGLSDHTRDVATRFAREGFVTLAVDLYRPLGKVEISDPGPFMRGLSDPDLLATIQRAVDLLRDHPAVSGRVGIVGFCMGGTYALLASALVDGLSAAAAFYGVLSHRHGLYFAPEGLDPAKKPLEPMAAAARLRTPLLAFFGDQDVFVPVSDIRELQAITEGNPDVEIHVVPGAGHAFANDTRPAAYEPEAARDAFARTFAFLHDELEDEG